MPMKLSVGDTVRLKKQHPCGGFEWQLTRVGADIGLRCLTCGRRVLLARSKVEKRIKAIVSTTVEASGGQGTSGGHTTSGGSTESQGGSF